MKAWREKWRPGTRKIYSWNLCWNKEKGRHTSIRTQKKPVNYVHSWPCFQLETLEGIQNQHGSQMTNKCDFKSLFGFLGSERIEWTSEMYLRIYFETWERLKDGRNIGIEALLKLKRTEDEGDERNEKNEKKTMNRKCGPSRRNDEL